MANRDDNGRESGDSDRELGDDIERFRTQFCRLTDRRSAACGDLPDSYVNASKDLDSNTLVNG
jgi:hypothetical protein